MYCCYMLLNKFIMARKQKMLLQQAMEHLEEADEGNGSEEDDVEDK